MKQKKFLSLLLALAMALSLAVPVLAEEGGEAEGGAWYAEAVRYVTDAGLMSATGEGFHPDGAVTRATVIQTLYNLEGRPAVTGAASFADVAGKWYADSAAWAGSVGLARGDGGAYAGERDVTRGEMAAIFARYAALKGIPGGGEAGLEKAPDYDTIPDWALEGMGFCFANDIMTGDQSGALRPASTAVRAELAVMLMKLDGLTALPEGGKTLRILATTDLHGWFVPWDFAMDQENTIGGLSLLSPIIAANRAEEPNTILVDCGDTVQANYSEYFIDAEKNPMIEAMNYLGYDVWNWGNHEYNFTADRRQKLIDAFDGEVLSGNIYYKDSGKQYLPAVTVIEKDGVKVGVIGMDTPMIADFEAGRGTLDDMEVRNPLDETVIALKALQDQKVDVIVGVYHMGLNKENEVAGTSVTEIAEAFPEIDVIIAGHTHKEVESQTVNGVLITEPKAYARMISTVDLVVAPDADGGYSVVRKEVKLEKAGEAEDEKLAELMAPYKAELQKYVNTSIGELKNSDLSKPDKIKGISSVFTEPTGILTLFELAGRYYAKADVVALNTDYENAGFPVGSISIKNISQSYSYSGGEVTVYQLTGAELKTFLEWCGGYYNQIQPGDLTISYDPQRREGSISEADTASGVTYWLDLTKPEGSRVQDLRLITEYDEQGLPVLDEDGKPATKPVTDDMEILFGCNSYDMDKLLSEGGPLYGHELETVFNSVSEWGDDGTVRALAIRYITEVLKGEVDGNRFNYDAWRLYTGIDETSAEYLKAVELINDGTLTLPALENGRTNIAPITVDDVKPYLEGGAA